jgi:hypothetical protein
VQERDRQTDRGWCGFSYCDLKQWPLTEVRGRPPPQHEWVEESHDERGDSSDEEQREGDGERTAGRARTRQPLQGAARRRRCAGELHERQQQRHPTTRALQREEVNHISLLSEDEEGEEEEGEEEEGEEERLDDLDDDDEIDDEDEWMTDAPSARVESDAWLHAPQLPRDEPEVQGVTPEWRRRLTTFTPVSELRFCRIPFRHQFGTCANMPPPPRRLGRR